MAGYKNITKIVVVSLIVGFVFAQVYENKKIDVQKFLENIRNMLKERMERAKRREEWKKRRKERKKEVKKMLIKKFSSFPRIRRPEDYIIHIRKDGTGGKVEDFLKKEMEQQKPEIKSISPQTINKVLRANPVFNPFKTDRLKDILNRIQRPQGNVQGNVQNSSTPTAIPATDHQQYREGLFRWFEEVYSKIQWFWDMVYILFILDKKRFEYLSEVLCKWEIINPSWLYYSFVNGCVDNNLPDRFKVIHIDNSTNMPCNSLDPHKLRVSTKWLQSVITCVERQLISLSINERGQCTPSLYTNARLIGNKGQSKVIKVEGIRPAYTSNRSLCYNLAALNFFGYERDLYRNYDSNYISSKVKSFIQYVQFMGKIYKDKIIPALVDMCYIRCLCEDIGIGCTKQQKQQIELSQEEAIMLILWKLQKDVFFYFIDSLSKLISFKEGLEQGRVAVCDEIQNDFKKIMGNIGKDIVEKRERLSQMKKKIEDMEKEGEVDTSVYGETIQLVEEVRKELTSIREALIELWQKRIESVATFDDLKDLKCVLNTFRILIESISFNNKNVLELSFNNLISLVKEKLRGTLRKLVDQFGTLDDVTKWLDVSMLLKNVGYELKDIIGSDSNPKTKGLIRFINMVGGNDTLYISFQSEEHINDLFLKVSALDYSIYVLTTLFNNLRCAIGNVTIEESLDYFLGYLVSQKKISPDDREFLQCFMSGMKTIKQCAGEKYGIIEDIIGDVTIESLGDLKDRIEELKKYEKWGDIPAIKACCGDDSCSIVHSQVIEWCQALTSTTFRECCNRLLSLKKCCDRTKSDCNPSSEPFCLIDDPDKIQCNSGTPSIAGDGSRCKNLSDKLESLFSISYNNNTRRIFCDVIENYGNFCDEPVGFINNIKDNGGTSVMANAEGTVTMPEGDTISIKYGELKCECSKCRTIASRLYICITSLSIYYTERNKMEGFLERVGLLEEAQKAIKGGLLKNFGQCPYQ